MIAAKKLGELQNRRAVKPLIKALKDKIPRVYEAAADALGMIGDQRAVEPLIHLLDEDSSCSCGKWALGELKNPSALPCLLKFVKHGGIFYHQKTALEAIIKILDNCASSTPEDVLLQIAKHNQIVVVNREVDRLVNYDDHAIIIGVETYSEDLDCGKARLLAHEELARRRRVMAVQLSQKAATPAPALPAGPASQPVSTQPPLPQSQLSSPLLMYPGEGERTQVPAKPGEIFTNNMGMKFVWIPGGTFMMGSPPDEEGRWKHEALHRVKLTKGYYLGIYPVTQKEWQVVMANNPSYNKIPDEPVDNVSWDDCQKFLAKLNPWGGWEYIQEGDNCQFFLAWLKQGNKQVYRLPTEAEWEYACRAGTATAYFFGDDPGQFADYAWLYSNPVGQKKPNKWGLYDMHGNVEEWCQDWFGDFPSGDQVDPRGPSTGDYHVRRCGKVSKLLCRAASRFGGEPNEPQPGRGFRVACDFVPRTS